jgi:4-amino-4-deoxy-L-arabinose transferase-like glycosyltransferase
MLGALAALAMVLWLWRGTRWWRKPALVIALILTVAATWFARQNHFEWMFNPSSHSAYAKATEAPFIGDEDMVLAVQNQGEAVAYPVRLMAYHHLVEDTVGGTPIVATY